MRHVTVSLSSNNLDVATWGGGKVAHRQSCKAKLTMNAVPK